MDSINALADRLASLVERIKAPWSDDEIVVATGAWNGYDRTRLRISTGLEAAFAEYSALRTARTQATAVPDADLSSCVDRIGTQVDGIVATLDRTEQELFELVEERSHADGVVIEGRRTTDSTLRSELETWRGQVRADLRATTATPSPAATKNNSGDSPGRAQPTEATPKPVVKAEARAVVEAETPATVKTKDETEAPATAETKDEAEAPTATKTVVEAEAPTVVETRVPTSAKAEAEPEPTTPTHAEPQLLTETAPAPSPLLTSATPTPQAPTPSTAPLALVLYCDDPALAGERPSPDEWPSSSVIRSSPSTPPSADVLTPHTGSIPWLVLYGSRGGVDDQGAPTIFDGHPPGAAADAWLRALADSGITAECLVADFSYSVAWLAALRPLLGDDGILVALAPHSEGALSTAAASILAAPAPPRDPLASILAVLRDAQQRLESRHRSFFGSPHAVYSARERLVIRSSDDGLYRYEILTPRRTNADADATRRTLEWLAQQVSNDGILREIDDRYRDADTPGGFLAEVERRLGPGA